MMESNLLSLHDVQKLFWHDHTAHQVLDHITYSFRQPSSYALSGVSGTGKSTLITLLAGLDTPSSGAVRFNKKNIATYTGQERALFHNQSVGLLLQQPYLIVELSAIENSMMPGLIAGMPHAQCRARADELFAQLGIEGKKHHKVGSLSGGQQQRVALARALFNRPSFLLADEPTGNLDQDTGRLIVALLVEMQRTYGMGMIVSTHDAYVASQMDYHLELREGALYESAQ